MFERHHFVQQACANVLSLQIVGDGQVLAHV